MSDALPNNFGRLWAEWRAARDAALKELAVELGRNEFAKPFVYVDGEMGGGSVIGDLAFERLCELDERLWEAGTAICRAREMLSKIRILFPARSDPREDEATASPVLVSETPANPDATERAR